jgi:hypothetical protein
MSNKTFFAGERNLRLILKSLREKFERHFAAIEKINFYGNDFATSVRLLSFKSFAGSSLSLSLPLSFYPSLFLSLFEGTINSTDFEFNI